MCGLGDRLWLGADGVWPAGLVLAVGGGVERADADGDRGRADGGWPGEGEAWTVGTAAARTDGPGDLLW